MPYYACMDRKVVIYITSVHDNDIAKDDGTEDWEKGRALLEAVTGWHDWERCSWRGLFRGDYPAIGDIYDVDNDEFVSREIAQERGVSFGSMLGDPDARLPEHLRADIQRRGSLSEY